LQFAVSFNTIFVYKLTESPLIFKVSFWRKSIVPSSNFLPLRWKWYNPLVRLTVVISLVSSMLGVALHKFSLILPSTR